MRGQFPQNHTSPPQDSEPQHVVAIQGQRKGGNAEAGKCFELMSLSELSTHGVGRIPLAPSRQEKDWLYHSPVKGTERGHGGI